MPPMTRKQLYIEERQDQELKLRAKILGVSEADVVRRAIDHFFQSANTMTAGAAAESSESVEARKQALSEFLVGARAIAHSDHELPSKRGRRDELYDERENRWSRGMKRKHGK